MTTTRCITNNCSVVHKSQGAWSEGLEQTGEIDEVFTFDSQQRTDIGCRKWSSQCGMVSGFGIGVHPDFKSHVSRTMTFVGGKGSAINVLAKQKLNTKSSTVAELVGVDCTLPLVLWVPPFLKEQGHNIKKNMPNR